MRTLLSVIVVSSLALTGCGSRDKRRRADAAPRPQFVGTITLVNETERFVLIDGGFAVLPEEVELRSFTGEIESGLLKPTAVRRRPFIIADIVSGSPKKGDRVFQ